MEGFLLRLQVPGLRGGDLPGGVADQEGFVRNSPLLIYAEANGCNLKGLHHLLPGSDHSVSACGAGYCAGTALRGSGGQSHGENRFSTGTSYKQAP